MTPADWDGARDEYVTEAKLSYADVAKKLGVSKNAVQGHALDRQSNAGKTWAEMRRDFQDAVGERSRGRIADVKVKAKIEAAQAAIEVNTAHRRLLQSIRTKLEKKILGDSDDPEAAVASAIETLEGRDAVKLLLELITAERKTHGLDRSNPLDDGNDGLDDGTRETVIRIAAAAGPADRAIGDAATALVEVALGRRARPQAG